MQTLTQSQFQAAFAHGAIKSVVIEPLGARFGVKFHALKGEAMLVQARKTEPRLFGTVDSALKLLHKLGVRRIVLDRLDRLEHWHPEQAALERRTRPDRAEALTRAAEYDRWVRAKVQLSRDDPRPAMADGEWRMAKHPRGQAGCPDRMSCAAWSVIRRPEYREDHDAKAAWIARDNANAAVAMWLLIC